ncbi:MAG: N-acetylmuramoyl-L-alanine amidase family protein [Bacillota bacterium]
MTEGRKVVVLDPGHGGRDPGAVGSSGLREADVNLRVGRMVKSRLERDCAVVMTRASDQFVGLGQRCDIANEAKAAVFISLHCNSATNRDACGAETYHHPASAQGRALAERLQRGLATLGLRDRGVRTAEFYVLRHTNMPAVLVELAFISNPGDEARLSSTEFLNSAADAIAEAVRDYLGEGRGKQ